MARTPVTSERDAFWLTITGVAITALAVLVGWLLAVWVGVALFVLAVLAAASFYLHSPDPARRSSLQEAAREPHPHRAQASRHVLVIANETLGGEELRRRILGSTPAGRGNGGDWRDGGDGSNGGVEVDVLAPVLTSHIHYGVSDIDKETEQARVRLRRSLEWVRAQGIRARGSIGDPNPVTAIEDQLRAFGPDEVIVVRHPQATWQERAELERLCNELNVPVEQVVVEDGGE